MSELSDREVDALVAEKVMGWKSWQSKHGYWNIDRLNEESISTYGRRDYSVRFDPQNGKKLPDVRWWEDCDELPHYSTDISAAVEVEDRIFSDEMNLRSYVAALRNVTEADDVADSINRDWMLIHATARQRCEAALAALSTVGEK